MALKKANWLLLVAVFLIQACSKDPLEKYEGEYSFVSHVTEHFPSTGDTIIYSTGSIKEVSSSVLEINYMGNSKGYSGVILIMPGQVQVKVDKDGKISPAIEYPDDIVTITGQFEDSDKLTMTLGMNSEYYGKLSTTVVKGTRIQK